MFERFPRTLIALIAGAALAAGATQVPAQAAAPRERDQVAAAATDGIVSARFERWATITKTDNGYYYDAGQQNTHLVITRVDGGVRLADRRTDVLRSKPDACNKKQARVGIVVICRVPGTVNARHPMTLKVFTRLGDDYINSSRLSAAFKLYMLCDAGHDIVHAGAGNDFINGAQNVDRVWGGPGNDRIRTGLGDDKIWGGAGRDQLVGVYGRDEIYGETGNDRVGGGPGNDKLFAGGGTDYVLCGPGRDHAHADRVDHVLQDCESVKYR